MIREDKISSKKNVTYLGLKGHQFHISMFFTTGKSENHNFNNSFSPVPLITGTGPTNYANAEYAGTQNPATANDCDKGALCAGSSSLFQGDSIAGSPINSQIYNYGSGGSQGQPGP